MIDDEARDVEEDLNHREESRDDHENGVDGLAAQSTQSGHQRDKVVRLRENSLRDLKSDQVVPERSLEVQRGQRVRIISLSLTTALISLFLFSFSFRVQSKDSCCKGKD